MFRLLPDHFNVFLTIQWAKYTKCILVEENKASTHVNENPDPPPPPGEGVLIGQQVCFHSAMKHENGVSNGLQI